MTLGRALGVAMTKMTLGCACALLIPCCTQNIQLLRHRGRLAHMTIGTLSDFMTGQPISMHKHNTDLHSSQVYAQHPFVDAQLRPW
jgi:hypothetical protein